MYPRFLQFGLLVISTYGVLALVAALCAVWLWTGIARRSGLDAVKIGNAALLSVGAVVIGARLAIIAANWRGFLEAPLLILGAGTINAGAGTPTLYGALLAAAVCCVYLRRGGLPLLRSLDAAAPALALAAAVLDVADFAAGSHYGTPTTLPWGVTYTSRFAARTAGVPLGVPLHPVQLYAAAAHFALAATLISMLRLGGRSGEVLGLGLFAEGVLHFLLAPLSGSYLDAPALLHIVTADQAAAMLLVTLGGGLWLAHAKAGTGGHSASQTQGTSQGTIDV